MRRVSLLVATVLLLVMVAVPAAADPPPESGVVIRIEATDSHGVFPDFENGYWVFANVTRDAFCTWFENMATEPFPMGETPDDIQVVFASDAEVVSIHAAGPSSLHPFTSDPFADPCTGSESEAALWGHLNVTVNDNDGPNEGKRAESFGDKGQGTLHDDSGAAYRYSWNFRAVWNPDATEFSVKTEKFNLHPIGNSG